MLVEPDVGYRAENKFSTLMIVELCCSRVELRRRRIDA
jgi:hypothetical protein